MVKFRLDSIKVRGFKSPEVNVSVAFAKTQTTAVYGRNGSGKTTLLRIISAVFQKNEKILLDEAVQMIKLCYTNMDRQYTLKIEKKPDSQIREEKDSLSTYYKWNDDGGRFNENQESFIYITTDRGLNNNRNRKLTVEDFAEIIAEKNVVLDENSSYKELNEMVAKINFLTSSINVQNTFEKNQLIIDGISMSNIEKLLLHYHSQEKRKIYIKLNEDILNLMLSTYMTSEGKKEQTKLTENQINCICQKWKLQKEQRDEYIKEIEQGYLSNSNIIKKQFKTIERIIEIWNHAKDIGMEHSKEIEILIYQNFSLLEQIVEVFSDYKNEIYAEKNICSVFEKYVENEKKLIITKEEVKIKIFDNEHELDKLSNGERQLLTFLTVLGLLGSKKDVILIDEPDISMDTDWQEELSDNLELLCPNSQIIFTTHSPDISINNHQMGVDLKVERGR